MEVKRQRIWTFRKQLAVDAAVLSGTRFVIEGRMVRVVRAEHEWDVDIETPSNIVNALKGLRRRVDIFTFAQRLPQTERLFDFHTEWDNVAAIPISTFERWWSQPVVKETRNKVRKSQKAGVEVKIAAFDDAFVEGARALFNESPIRQGKPMLHYAKDFDTIKRLLATFSERSDYIGAYYQGELIGFLKLVSSRPFTRTMHIMSALRHRDKAPTNALIAKAVQLCSQRGIPYLVYGQFDYGKRGSRTLTDFKRYAGFERIELPRYYVPLSPLGWLWLRCRLHHGVIELLPQRLLNRILDLRAGWYRWRYSAGDTVRDQLGDPEG